MKGMGVHNKGAHLLLEAVQQQFKNKNVTLAIPWDLNGKSHGKIAQYKWFKDVLTEYSRAIQGHPKIEKSAIRIRETLKKSEENVLSGSGFQLPINGITAEKPGISYDEFYKFTRYRRSVRWFLNQNIPGYHNDKAILAAIHVPSACNRHPLKYFIIDNRDLLKDVAKISMGIKGYEIGIPIPL